MSFRIETEFRDGMILLARSQDRARKTGLIRAVGKVDGLHEHSTEFLDRPVFSFICPVETSSFTGVASQMNLSKPKQINERLL